MGMPLLVGAGLGAGTNLLRGKGVGGILKGAALGGALGGIGGGLNGLANGGSFLEGAGLNGLSGATANAGIGEAVIPGSIESSGMVFNPATGSYLAPESYLGASSSMPVFTGGEGLLSNGISNITDMMPQSLSEYATPKNLLGVGQVLSAMPANQAPLQNIGSGSISQGQMPQYTPFNTGTPAWKKRNQ
jgi:hypothetical protein